MNPAPISQPWYHTAGALGEGTLLTEWLASIILPAARMHAMRRVVFPRHRARSLVEEAPAAYRDIREVIEDQDDLVRPLLRLEPIAVLKE